MHRVGAADGCRSGFGHSEMADLAGSDQLGHRAEGFLDRYLRIDPVRVVEIDVVALQTAQAGVASGARVLGSAPHDAPAVDRQLTELRGQEDPIPPTGERPTQ